MLARLDEALAPMIVSVNREGTLLRVAGDSRPDDLDRRLAAVVEPLGYFAAAAVGPEPAAEWFRSGDIDRLSQHEARVLAAEWIEEITQQQIVDDPGRLDEVIRGMLLEAFRTAARTGVIDALHVDQTILLRALDEPETAAMRRWLAAKLGTPAS